MIRALLKSEIHGATVTDANLHYVGSISLDPALLGAADLAANELVHVVNHANGARFETYTILGRCGEVCLNGAAARLVAPGDVVDILAYAGVAEIDIAGHRPSIVFVNERNAVVEGQAAGRVR